jgi:hypothetical protein
MYCVADTADPVGCPAGTFSNVKGLKNASECQLCSYGKYCGEKNLTSPSGDCYAGFYCLRGSSSPNPATVSSTGGPCPKGHFCKNGTSHPKGCRAGTYNPNTGEGECFTCMERYYCPENSTDFQKFPCPPGHFCPNGTKHGYEFSCPKGYYNDKAMAKSISDCIPCKPGYYCNKSGLTEPSAKCAAGWYCISKAYVDKPMDLDNFTSGDCICPSNATGGECPPGHYCPEGSDLPKPCTGGYYCSGTRNINETDYCSPGYYCTKGAWKPKPDDGVTGGLCPEGRYCPRGTHIPLKCKRGTFSNTTGNSIEDHCRNCTAGSYCGKVGLTATSGLCSPGFYCPAGQFSETAFPCTRGHFCEEGSPLPTKCESGTYQDETQQSKCKLCPSGYYCDFNDDLQDFSSYLCPRGYYCPNGTRYAVEYGCPNGTYGNDSQLTSADQCLQCPPGKYCKGE